MDAARDAGVNLAFFGGNDIFWKTYYSASTLIPARRIARLCATRTRTKTTSTTRIIPTTGPARGPTRASVRRLTVVRRRTPRRVRCSRSIPTGRSGPSRSRAAMRMDRLWRNTSIASLGPNDSATLSFGTLGYEFDSDVDNGYRPAGEFDLSSTTVSTTQLLLDYGNTFGNGTATNSITEYRASSGALVFSTGSQVSSWGLDDDHDGPSVTPDQNWQQAVINLFADMGVQPGSLMSGLVPATMSTDHTAPTSTITSPVNGAVVKQGVPITITGTAKDSGGGVVAGVEVSIDGGLTWHPATGHTSWSYTWTPTTSGQVTIMSRAADDSGNIETPTDATVTVNPTASQRTYHL